MAGSKAFSGFTPGQPYTRRHFWDRIHELAAGRVQDMGALRGIFNGAYSGPPEKATVSFLRRTAGRSKGSSVSSVMAAVAQG
jgi:hypothetical protein